MQQTDMQKFAELMTGVGLLYEMEINDQLIEIYWRSLNRYDFDAVKEAFEAHVNHPDLGQFKPKPADITRYLEGSSKTQSYLAWSKVHKALSSVGAYSSIVFDDPIIHVVIGDMGGWVMLCHTTVDELPFKANEFQNRYDGYVTHQPDTFPNKLTGIIEQENGGSSYRLERPIFWGDQEKCLLVHQNKNINRPTLSLVK